MSVRHCLWFLASVAAFTRFCAADDAKPSQPAPAKKGAHDRAKLEEAFSKRLTGAAMVGTFTVDGKKDDKPASDRYEIASARKLEGDRWLITARIKYGKNDLTVPVPIDVLWAGDTPVITLTNLTIPGLGTFTSRVMVYGDRYAGTWQHDAVGGHMWGRIEANKPESKPGEKSKPADAPPAEK